MEARYELPCLEGRAAFVAPTFPRVGGTAHSVNVELRLGDVVARLPLSVYTDGGHTIVDFFAELASDWAGWSGGRTWYDDSVRFLVTAVHDGRRQVELNFRARSDMPATLDDAVSDPGAWLVEGAVSVAPGSLTDIHEGLRALIQGRA